MVHNVIYIGNMFEVAEEIFFHENFNLKAIFAEKDRISDEMLTFAYIRNIDLIGISHPAEILENGYNYFDFAIMCSYGRKIPKHIINKIKIINIHYGILPSYKGRHPSFYAFMNNEKYLGVTAHEVNEKIDEGNIITMYKIENRLLFTEIDIFNQQIRLIKNILNDIDLFHKDKKYICAIGKDNYYPPVKPHQTEINIEKDAIITMFNKVKAQARYGGPKISIKNKTYFIYKCLLTSEKINDLKKLDNNIYINNKFILIEKENQLIKLYYRSIN